MLRLSYVSGGLVLLKDVILCVFSFSKSSVGSNMVFYSSCDYPMYSLSNLLPSSNYGESGLQVVT